MHALMRISAVLFVVVLLAVGVFALPYALSPNHLVTEDDRSEKLQLWREVIWHHRENQFQAVQEWKEQRCTLEETMQRFGELEREYAQEWPPFRDLVRQSWPLSDEERHFPVILNRLQELLHDRPREMTAVRRRLEGDYQQLLAGRQKLGSASDPNRARSAAE